MIRMSEAQAAHSRARRMNRIGLSLSVRFRLSHGMVSGRCAPENDQAHRRRWSVAELPSGAALCWQALKRIHLFKLGLSCSVWLFACTQRTSLPKGTDTASSIWRMAWAYFVSNRSKVSSLRKSRDPTLVPWCPGEHCPVPWCPGVGPSYLIDYSS